MNASDSNRAVRPPHERHPLAIQTRRECSYCAGAAELVDVNAVGIAFYVCPQHHENQVDVSSAISDAQSHVA